MDFSSDQISFLDLWIKRDKNILHTGLYKKPTASNTLLKADSCHPLPLKNSHPYSQLCRFRRICSEDFDRNVVTLRKKFIKKNKLILWFKKAKTDLIHVYLKGKVKTKNSLLFLLNILNKLRGSKVSYIKIGMFYNLIPHLIFLRIHL